MVACTKTVPVRHVASDLCHPAAGTSPAQDRVPASEVGAATPVLRGPLGRGTLACY